jgi:hypothetical protein
VLKKQPYTISARFSHRCTAAASSVVPVRTENTDCRAADANLNLAASSNELQAFPRHAAASANVLLIANTSYRLQSAGLFQPEAHGFAVALALAPIMADFQEITMPNPFG